LDKQSIFELQKIDCNCNDCRFMIRDVEKYKASLDAHHTWQWDYFCTLKEKLIKKARWYRRIFYDIVRWDALFTEAESMKFQFDRSTCAINFGTCEKFHKDISFIPNTCQLDTQDCFEHRRNIH
jgi:hypothetical protein